MSWSRRNRGYRAPTERASIGDGHVHQACVELNGSAARMVAIMAQYEHTAEQTLPMLFDDDLLDRLRAIKGAVEPRSETGGYNLGDLDDEDNPDQLIYPTVQGARLFISYTGLSVPTVTECRLKPNPDRAGPLVSYIEEVKAIHMKFEEVKAVLRWMNRNATPGAIRYNFPAAIKLCPGAPALADMHEVPTRHTNPPRIGVWTDSIKRATTTLASMAMMPAVSPTPRDSMWLTFNSTKVELGGDEYYTTDHMTYFI